MVEDPAFKGARVLAVREDDAGDRGSGRSAAGNARTRRDDADPIIAWAMQRKAS
jgi:hypothetical protein